MAKTVKPKNTDVIVVEAVEDIPLEKQIDNTLIKHNVTEAVIAGLKEKYGGLVLRSIDNKEDYLEIKAAKKEVRKWGILTEQICKKGREDAIATQKKWLTKEKEILGKIAEVETPLEAEIKKYEDEQERLEQEEIRRKENAFAVRQSQLIKMGATYSDGHYVLDHVSFDSTLIKEAEEDTWVGMLSKYQAQYEKNEVAKIEEENRRLAAAEALRVQQEEMNRQRRELEAQQEEFKRQQEELQKQRDEAARIQRESEEADRKRKREQEVQIINSRVTQLKGVTWNGVTPSFHYNHQIIATQDSVLAMTEDEFILFRDTHNSKVEKDILDAEEKRQAEIKERERIAAENAAKVERERIAEEQRQQKLREEMEANRKAEEAAQATDKTKWQVYIAYHTSGVVPEMKSPSYRNKIAEAQKLMQKIINL